MKITNIHARNVKVPIADMRLRLKTLGTKADQLWPVSHWPRMKFKDGIHVGSAGGHGPIRYTIRAIEEDKVVYQFNKPAGFNGIHKMELQASGDNSTIVRHSILVDSALLSSIQWISFIKVLHEALINDAFNQIENQYSDAKIEPNYSFWVKTLRKLLGA